MDKAKKSGKPEAYQTEKAYASVFCSHSCTFLQEYLFCSAEAQNCL